MSLRSVLLRKKRTVTAAPGVEPDDELRYGKIDLPLVRRMGELLLPFRNLYLAGIGLGIIHITMEMLGPQVMRKLVDFTLGQAGIRATLSPQQLRHDEWVTAGI